METIKEKLEKLSEKWKSQRNYDYFVYDGILNYHKWSTAHPKILFLLKETADDFTQIAGTEINITKGNGSHFWWNICYWKYLVNGIYNGENPEFIDQNELPEVKYNNNILDSIAYVNVKKNCENKTHTDDGEILKYAQEDKNLLMEQIDLINPHVVFCNNITFASYRHIYENELIQINSICYRHKDRLILHFRHPSYFQIAGGRETHFNDLKSALLDNGNVLNQFNWVKN